MGGLIWNGTFPQTLPTLIGSVLAPDWCTSFGFGRSSEVGWWQVATLYVAVLIGCGSVVATRLLQKYHTFSVNRWALAKALPPSGHYSGSLIA